MLTPKDNVMTPKIRRVVTGHKKDGKATVLVDDVRQLQPFPGTEASGTTIWIGDGLPVNNDDSADTANREIGIALDNAVVFRIVSFGPGVAPYNHRTDTIDFAVILDGECDMELDDEKVHFKAGDVLVQRGTIHNWRNNGTKPCTIAFTLVPSKPVTTAGGKVLNAVLPEMH